LIAIFLILTKTGFNAEDLSSMAGRCKSAVQGDVKNNLWFFAINSGE